MAEEVEYSPFVGNGLPCLARKWGGKLGTDESSGVVNSVSVC